MDPKLPVLILFLLLQLSDCRKNITKTTVKTTPSPTPCKQNRTTIAIPPCKNNTVTKPPCSNHTIVKPPCSNHTNTPKPTKPPITTVKPPPCKSNTTKNPHCVCPKFDSPNEHQDNSSNEEYRKLVNALWNSSSPVLGETPSRMKKAILMMANSDSSLWNSQALAASLWIWANIPSYKSKPDLCTFAQIVNASVVWNKRKDAEIMRAAIDTMTMNTQFSSMRMLEAALRGAGCKPPPNLKIPTLKCFCNGDVYKIEEMWQRRGDEFPCGYRRAALLMYDSDTWLHKAMAAIATASLEPAFVNQVNMFNTDYGLKIFRTQLIGKIPECCCEAFTQHVSSYVEKVRIDSIRVGNELKKAYPVRHP